MKTSHALTIELPSSVYQAFTELATDRGISIVALAREAIEEKARRRRETDDLAEAYEILSEDPEAADVEPFFRAQAEAVRE